MTDIRDLIIHKEVCRRDLDEKMDRGLERGFGSSGSGPTSRIVDRGRQVE